MKTKYIIFDLDDTLVYEFHYLQSAFKEIAGWIDTEDSEMLFNNMILWYKEGKNVFDMLEQYFSQYTKSEFLEIYRSHLPNVQLNPGTMEVLDYCKVKGYKLGLLTDGRSVTQRNKLKATGIEEKFDKIIISEEFGSEKPSPANYIAFYEEGITDYFYIADNPKKDFIVPNKLGWTSICLLSKGENIHNQNFDMPFEFLPKYKISFFKELFQFI